ncbi:MAG: WD40/YVTN/BNR-like repeat-containing protein [Stellaceae bacterium]
MTGPFTLCVGTVGSGAWTSPDGGESWQRVRSGLWGESRIYGLAVHPREPRTVFAGADDGIYKSQDGGQKFARLDSPMNKMDVWKIAFDPADPDTIYAGTRPAALFRSTDGGRQWRQLPVDMVEECPNVGVPRVTALTVDPSDGNIVWAGVEVDGVRRSLDRGETWTRIAGGLSDPDIHDVAVRGAGNTRTVLTSTPREIFASTDKGESWQGLGVGKQFGLPYCRSLALKSDDPNTVFVATGDGAAGSTGAIQRSKDGGASWEALPLPVTPNSPIWAFATHLADPGLIVACSHYGELYASPDAGDSWRKLPREFTEIRALAWTPN